MPCGADETTVLDHTERLTKVETVVETLSNEMKSIRRWLMIGVLSMFAQGGDKMAATAKTLLQFMLGG